MSLRITIKVFTPPLPDFRLSAPAVSFVTNSFQQPLNMTEKDTDHGHVEKVAKKTGLDLEASDVGGQEKEINDVLAAEHVLAQFDEHETRRVLRKIDCRLVPLLAVLYL